MKASELMEKLQKLDPDEELEVYGIHMNQAHGYKSSELTKYS